MSGIPVRRSVNRFGPSSSSRTASRAQRCPRRSEACAIPQPSSWVLLRAIATEVYPAGTSERQSASCDLGLYGTVQRRYGEAGKRTEGDRDGPPRSRIRERMGGGTEGAPREGEGADPAERRARGGAPAPPAHEGREGLRVRGPAGEGRARGPV